jgi:acyl-CoA thioester hydrolase
MPGVDPKSLLGDFRVFTTVPVQWGDQDAFAHVNNTIFLRWFEVGRIDYFEKLAMPHDATGRGLGPILASVTCNFRQQVTYPDRVLIGTRISRIGKSSMVVDHEIVSEHQGRIVADGTSIVVYFDYAAGRSCPVPDDLRRAIDAIESATRNPNLEP